MNNTTQQEIEKLEEEQFILDMKDVWDDSDYKKSNEIHQKILELKGQLVNENK